MSGIEAIARGTEGRAGYSFVASLFHLTIDYPSLSRRVTGGGEVVEESAQGQEREIPQAVAHARPPTTKTRKGASGDMTRLRAPIRQQT